MKQYWKTIIAVVLAILLSVSSNSWVHSQVDVPSGDKIDGFPVLLADETLFVIQTNINSFTSEERAKTITNRLQNIADDSSVDLNLLKLDEQESITSIVIGDKILVTLTEADATAARRSRASLANEYLNIIQNSLQVYREERSFKYLIRSIIFTVISTVALIVIQIVLNKIFPLIYRILDSWREAHITSVRVQNIELIRESLLVNILRRLVGAIRWIVVLFVFYLYLPLVLSFFPWTKHLGRNLFGYLASAFWQVFQAIINYLPNLFIVVVIFLLTYFIVRFVKVVFGELERGDISLPGFYQEWAAPTYKLSLFLILALAVIVAFPYLPGSGSPAFQGVSIFLGLLLSLGSTAAVANIVGGIILIYTRAFEVGDRVQIGDAEGDIVEKSLLVTRLRTPKNLVITMPNSTVLTSNVINFSATIKDPDTPPLILNTTITLGYDVPWRQVHQVLREAAISTPNILTEPAPFILQTSLDDFYVSYELNAYTNKSLIITKTYSLLHQNIQDKCNESEIEILSPHYSALRDGNQNTIPKNYLSKN